MWVARVPALQMSGGRTLQAGGTARTEAPRQEYARGFGKEQGCRGLEPGEHEEQGRKEVSGGPL